MRRAIVAYVSGHGFGHYTRSAPVLERLAGACDLHLRTNGRALHLARAAPSPWSTIGEVDVGPGVAQAGPLAIDLPATRAALEAHLAAWPRLIADEANFVRAHNADLIFADVPSVAFAIAQKSGVPAVALSNFSWSFIYRAYADEDPWFAAAADHLAEAESRCDLLLALEMGGGLDHFPMRRAIAPVRRLPTRPREAIRRDLPLAPGDSPIVLLSFGGFGADLDLRAALRDLGGYRALVVSAPVENPGPEVQPIAPTAALPHQDLVFAVDCVVGKPGYGTVAECLARPTPFAYAPRGRFAEYPPLVAAMERWLPCAAMPAEALAEGAWPVYVARAMAAHPPEAPPTGDGAAEAARAIAERLGI